VFGTARLRLRRSRPSSIALPSPAGRAVGWRYLDRQRQPAMPGSWPLPCAMARS